MRTRTRSVDDHSVGARGGGGGGGEREREEEGGGRRGRGRKEKGGEKERESGKKEKGKERGRGEKEKGGGKERERERGESKGEGEYSVCTHLESSSHTLMGSNHMRQLIPLQKRIQCHRTARHVGEGNTCVHVHSASRLIHAMCVLSHLNMWAVPRAKLSTNPQLSANCCSMTSSISLLL